MAMEMKKYVEACAAGAGARRQAALLERIVAEPTVHARFVNTLSRLEYVGVRKMLKSRRSEALDLDGLQHMLDETVHALRLKKIATALAGAGAGAGAVDTYGGEHTLAGPDGEAYMQGLDAAAAEALADLPEAARAEANYRLTSAAIEVRAQVFYPIYERCLRARGATFSVVSIMRDEDRHLDEMAASLEQLLGPEAGPRRLEPLLAVEERLFTGFLDAVEAAATASAPRAST
jgi:hypothetical protein